TGLLSKEVFSGAIGDLPTNWSQWASKGSFAVSTDRALSASSGLASTGASGQTSRAWVTASQPADVQVTASVYVDSLIPAEVIARGRSLDGDTPGYYAVSVTRGLGARLVKVVNGVTTTLDSVQSDDYLSGRWVRVTLYVSGTSLRAQIYRPDTRQYLNASGQWQSTAAWALGASDASISSGGLV